MSEALGLPPVPHIRSPHRPVKTGSWRMSRPVIDQGKCNCCLVCWVYCPDGAIIRDGEMLTVDLDYCKGCGICASECRRGAIAMRGEG